MGIALDKINKIKVVEYDWKDGTDPSYTGSNTHDIGIIAEELAKIIPEAVWYKDGRIEGIKPLTMIGILVKAIQELQEK
jgi:hypothetical protein